MSLYYMLKIPANYAIHIVDRRYGNMQGYSGLENLDQWLRCIFDGKMPQGEVRR